MVAPRVRLAEYVGMLRGRHVCPARYQIDTRREQIAVTRAADRSLTSDEAAGTWRFGDAMTRTNQQRRTAGGRWAAVCLAASVAGLALVQGTFAETAPESAVKTVKLRHVVLPDAADVVSRPANGIPTLTSAGYVTPSDVAEFTGDAKSVSFALRGDSISMLRESAGPNKWAFGMRLGQQLVLLRESANSLSLRSATVTLSDKQPYTLAFPLHNSAWVKGQPAYSRVWYRSGAVQAGKVDGTDIVFYDSNCDGSYRAQDDAMRVGVDCRVPVFAPMSGNFATARAIYHIDGLTENASELRYTAYTGKTGKVAVAGTSPGTEIQLALQSKDADLSMVCGANQPATLALPGKYEIAYGTVADAAGNLVAVIAPGSVGSIEVADGKVQTVRVGGPVSLEFKASLKNEKLQIDPDSFRIQGKNGEQYLKAQWAELPEIGVQRGKTIRRLGKMAFG
jgi:hypothetical protein